MGAVGPSHVVDFTEGGFTVHDKATGKVLRHLSQHEFWSRVEPAGAIVELLQPLLAPGQMVDFLPGRLFQQG